MPNGGGPSIEQQEESHRGSHAGVVLARRIKNRYPPGRELTDDEMALVDALLITNWDDDRNLALAKALDAFGEDPVT